MIAETNQFIRMDMLISILLRHVRNPRNDRPLTREQAQRYMYILRSLKGASPEILKTFPEDYWPLILEEPCNVVCNL